VAELPRTATAALDRFASRLERLRIEDLPLYATRPIDRAAERIAQDEADRLARETNRTAAIDRATASAVDWVSRLYSRQQNYPEWVGATWGRATGTADDRVEVARSLSRAITAIALDDVLDETTRDDLLGAWAALAT
jgi:hypothetical protein